MRSEAVLHAQDYMQILRSRWKVVLLVFLLVFVSSAVITKMMTPQYSSGMSFEIKMPRDIINVAVGGEGNPIAAMADNNAYMQTQFEILVSQQNLIAVANKLDLPNEWGVDETGAAARLSRVIDVMPRKNTNLVDIMVEMDDPRVAQQVCQAVVDCYKEIREEKENGVINEAINKRYEVLRSRQDELERKADVVRQYIRSGKYVQGMWNGQAGYSSPISTGAEEQTLQQLNNNRLQMETEIAQMTVHIGKLQGLKDAELLGYVTRTGLLTAESYCSAKVRELNNRYTEEENNRTQMLLSGYGVRHPNVLRLDEQHKATRDQLYEDAQKEGEVIYYY